MVRNAYILAGGKSSRFGSNKAITPIGGQPQLLRLAQAISADGWSTTIVTQESARQELLALQTTHPLHVIVDLEPDQGPVAGVLAALSDLQERLNHSNDGIDQSLSPSFAYGLFVPCDLWVWQPAWTERFLEVVNHFYVGNRPNSEGANLLVGLRRHPSESDLKSREEFIPFPCWLHVEALSIVQRVWDEGQRSMRSVFRALESRTDWIDVTAPEDDAILPRSFNTREELGRLGTGERPS